MREIRPYGSEGGEAQANEPSLPLSKHFTPSPPVAPHQPKIHLEALGVKGPAPAWGSLRPEFVTAGDR